MHVTEFFNSIRSNKRSIIGLTEDLFISKASNIRNRFCMPCNPRLPAEPPLLLCRSYAWIVTWRSMLITIVLLYQCFNRVLRIEKYTLNISPKLRLASHILLVQHPLFPCFIVTSHFSSVILMALPKKMG